MFENLKSLSDKYDELQQRMMEPDTYLDQSKYTICEKEFREIQPVVEKYREYLNVISEMEALTEIRSDLDMAELADEEQKRLELQQSQIEDEIKLLMLPKDPNDNKNIIMEIRGGVGGEEGMLFAADLFRMYSMYAERKGWKIEIANINETELGGIKEISFIVEGAGAYSRLKYESGGHRVQRVPVTESGGRIHTSAATVAVMPEIDEVDFQLDMNDVRIDVFRSSGAGGQKVNKTSSAIRVTYIPTGLVIECQDERSQYKNKDRALQILRSKLYEEKVAEQNAAVAADRKNQIGSGDRSDRIRTYNFPQNRVTDHRLEGDNRSFNISSVINGNLDPVIDALIMDERAEKLAEFSEV